MNQIIDDLTAVALQFGLGHQLANDLANAVVDRMSKSTGGVRLYIPKNTARRARNLEIKYLYQNGVPVRDLVRKYSISFRTVRRILRVGKE